VGFPSFSFSALKAMAEKAFISPPTECREVFNMLLRDALPNFMVWDAGGGRWWAATKKQE